MDDVVRQVLEREYGLRIGRRVGRGGMAEVYCAESAQGVPCALKVSYERLHQDQPSVQKELENLRLVQRVSGHPHVVTLMDYWLVDDYLITRWELSTEGSLAEVLAQQQAAGQPGIPREPLWKYLLDAAEGIDFLNGQGIYHRDIKPHNLLLFHGRVKLADLGLAKFAGASTASHTGSGTFGYLPPEAYDEHRLSKTVDLYSLAATYVKLRTGQEPFGTSPQEVVERQKAGQPVLDGLDPDEAAWVRQALAFRPEDRPQGGAVAWLNNLKTTTQPAQPKTKTPTEASLQTVATPKESKSLERVQIAVRRFKKFSLEGVSRVKSKIRPRVFWAIVCGLGVSILLICRIVVTQTEETVIIPAPSGEYWYNSGAMPYTAQLEETVVVPQTPYEQPSPEVHSAPIPESNKHSQSSSDPVATLLNAVAQAAPGAELKLAVGTYRLRDPLRIDKSLTLRGPGRDTCIIQCDAEGAVIEFTGSGRLNLHGVTVQHVGQLWANGLVVHDGEVQITDCRFTGAIRHAALKRGGVGLWVRGTARGVVQGCEFTSNWLHGIAMEGQSQLELVANRSEKNVQCGILYTDFTAGIARENTCYDNGCHGIGVQGQSRPYLVANRCEYNSQCGIIYFRSAAGVALNNTCITNGENGIDINAQACPELVANRCDNNKGSGIAYFDSAAGTARDNTCTGNGLYGIAVYQQARPTLSGNRLENNKRQDFLDDR